MTQILIAIDGTDASEYKTSWIKRFYKEFKGEEAESKFYSDRITTLGRECDDIFEAMKIHITEAMAKYGERNVKLSIIGHSRGGYIALALANSIKYKTHFLGLLDPVNMRIKLNGFHDTSKIDHKKVENIFYAKRDESFSIDAALARGSAVTTLFSDTRIYFGYALDLGETPRLYKTSHGGIGGDPFPKEENFNWFKNATGYFNDVTCKSTALRKPMYSSRTTVQESLKICKDESQRVWNDLIEFAKRPEVNLPI